jgi:hypothetical protein
MTPLEQEGFVDDYENKCDGPCRPDDACPRCWSYWERMKSEGYWDAQRGQWTDKGWSDILRHA